MENARLLQCLDADFARLREVAAGADLTAHVPSCPEWSVADLVRHVGAVYLHKVEGMRTGAVPSPWPPPGLNDEEPIALLDRAYAALAAELTARDPGQPTPTWYEPDQTVGFWVRRMAQETVIHRVDAELGAGVEIAPIPPDLARDGIDELLVAFVGYGSRALPEEYAATLAAAQGTTVGVRAGQSTWRVRPTPDGVEVRSVGTDEGESADAVVSGEPAPMLLWLWNRASDGVNVSGDTEAVDHLRRVLVAGTQ